MTSAAWEELRAELARVLEDLAVDGFVVLGEPSAEPGPPQGLLRRRAAPPPTRYVQYLRDTEDLIYAECIGARSFGGDWEVPDDTDRQLRDLGWKVPGEPGETGQQPPVPNYWTSVRREDSATAAGMGVRALELLGADPTGLEWQRGP